MTQLLKAAVVSLVIALSLTSDTALSASQVQSSKFQVPRSELRLSTSFASCVNSGQMPKSWDCLSCLRQAQAPIIPTLPCTYLMP